MVSKIVSAKNKLSKLIGLPVWGVKRGIGTFLTFEFGSPHMRIREPVVGSKILQLTHRHITIAGEWHLWIENAHWDIKTKFHHFSRDQIILRNKSSNYSDFDECLNFINGQIISNIKFDENNFCLSINFDLGGFLEFRPDEYTKGTQWSLFKFDKCMVSYNF